jgi:hypothetical protein
MVSCAPSADTVTKTRPLQLNPKILRGSKVILSNELRGSTLSFHSHYKCYSIAGWYEATISGPQRTLDNSPSKLGMQLPAAAAFRNASRPVGI